MLRRWLIAVLVAGSFNLSAHTTGDTAQFRTLNEYFSASRFQFNSRSYFMGTQQKGLLKDDFSLAQGGNLGIQTPYLRGFRANLSGYFIYNLVSSDLAKPDSITGGLNRYEAGQFDITDRGTTKGLERIEQLNLEYERRGLHVQLGRFQRETPFFNAQDGRMRPTLEEGLWVRQKLGDWTLRGAGIWAVSPRSTVNWYPIAQSVGLYGRGFRADGTPSNYRLDHAGNLLWIAGAQGPISKRTSLELWSMAFPNVLHSHTAHVEFRHNGYKLRLLGLAQGRLGDGGNTNPLLAYVPQHHRAFALSGNLSIPLPQKRYVALSATRITAHGAYIMPREWGRDPFYTFMSRERNEGLGDVRAATLMFGVLRPRGSHEINVGVYDLPDLSNFALNRYGMPSYWHLNLAGRIRAQKALEGLVFRYLITYKGALYPGALTLAQHYNRVGLWHLSLSADYAFTFKK